MTRQARKTKIVNLMENLLITLHCSDCNVFIKLDLPKEKWFTFEPSTLPIDHKASQISNLQITSGGTDLYSIFSTLKDKKKTVRSSKIKKKKKDSWDAEHDLLLKGIIKLFGLNFHIIRLLMPDFNLKILMSKIIALEWQCLASSDKIYKELRTQFHKEMAKVELETFKRKKRKITKKTKADSSLKNRIRSISQSFTPINKRTAEKSLLKQSESIKESKPTKQSMSTLLQEKLLVWSRHSSNKPPISLCNVSEMDRVSFPDVYSQLDFLTNPLTEDLFIKNRLDFGDVLDY